MPNQLNINNYDDEGNLIGVTDPITELTSDFTSDAQAYIEEKIYSQLLQFLLVEQVKQQLL